MRSKKRLFFRIFVVSAMSFIFTLSGYAAERVADCPAENVKDNVFDASALGKSKRRHEFAGGCRTTNDS